MTQLIHNIDYIIASVCILIVMASSTGRQFTKVSKSNRIFYMLVNCLFWACIFDIFMNVCQSFTDIFTPTWANISKMMYSVVLSVLCALAYYYIRSYQIDEIKITKFNVFDYIVIIATIIPIILSIINIFVGTIAYIDADGKLQNGPFYLVTYIAPFMVLAIVAISALSNKNKYTKDQLKAIVAFVILIMVFEVVEVIVGGKYVIGLFGCTLAIIIIQNSLETPDVARLNKSLKDLDEANLKLDKLTEKLNDLEKENERLNIESIASHEAAKVANMEAGKSARLAEEMRRAAVTANQSKNDFYTKMSTQLRNPLSVIMGMNEVIYNESVDEGIKEYAKNSLTASNELLEMFNDVFDYNKIKSNSFKINEEEYDLKEFVEKIYPLHLKEAMDKGLSFSAEIDENIPKKLIGDSFRIKQVLDKMISTAIKHTSKGSVTLKISLEGKGRTSVLIKYVVKDTGRGLKDDELKSVYDMIYPTDDAAIKRADGVGTGLSIISEILNLMGTRLNMDSEFGLGSVFSFSLRQSFVGTETVEKIEFENKD